MPADRQHRDRAGEAGFTLLEVVIASVIAALALVALFQAAGGGVVAADAAAREEEAVELAQSHLAAFGRAGAIVAGDWAGDDGGGYRWQLRARPRAEHPVTVTSGTGAPLDPRLQATADLVLYDIAVTISWPGGDRYHSRSVTLETSRIGAALAGQ